MYAKRLLAQKAKDKEEAEEARAARGEPPAPIQGTDIVTRKIGLKSLLHLEPTRRDNLIGGINNVVGYIRNVAFKKHGLTKAVFQLIIGTPITTSNVIHPSLADEITRAFDALQEILHANGQTLLVTSTYHGNNFSGAVNDTMTHYTIVFTNRIVKDMIRWIGTYVHPYRSALNTQYMELTNAIVSTGRLGLATCLKSVFTLLQEDLPLSPTINFCMSRFALVNAMLELPPLQAQCVALIRTTSNNHEFVSVIINAHWEEAQIDAEIAAMEAGQRRMQSHIDAMNQLPHRQPVIDNSDARLVASRDQAEDWTNRLQRVFDNIQ
ncbi:hypothetical protein BC941DRAFT_475651 [Chlamydoabsidia padenii]|nr:hypothetical protein BC941DRAFT_475651 [Chlamydoabsidia padenii]